MILFCAARTARATRLPEPYKITVIIKNMRAKRIMENKMFICALMCALAFVFLAGCPLLPPLPPGGNGTGNNTTITTINSFEECAAAGYPIMESYPEQCRTPDGRNFIAGTDFIESLNKINDTCSADSDCMLINKDLEFGCCGSGECQEIDYSQSKWIAVNGAWFRQVQEQNCRNAGQCAPAPLCPIRLVNDSFEARCVNRACQKAPKPDYKGICESQGGQWIITPVTRTELCSFRTPDSGKACNDSTQCAEGCIAQLTDEQKQRLKRGESVEATGTCAPSTVLYGCYFYVSQGKARPEYCTE